MSQPGLRRNERISTTITLTEQCTLIYLYASNSYANGVGDISTWSEIQLEVESNATQYEPCHGSTTNYEFGVLGKNKFDNNTVINNSWIRAGNLSEENPLGTIVDNANGYTLSQYIPVYSDTIYTIKYNATSTATAAGMVFFSEQDISSAIIGISLYYQTYINTSTTREYYTFTTPANCHYLRITTPPNASNVQLELGSTATTYEPYNPNKTVYGGWVDLISGEVCETHSLKTFNGSEQQWTWNSSNKIPYIAIDSMKSGSWYSDTYTICDTAIKVNASSTGALQCLIGYNNKRIYFYNTTSTISGVTDLNSFTDWLSTNNISITYPLETPNTYHLAPTSMQTFLSHNNIWSNADYVEVEYDLHETQTILARKQFIIAN